MTNRIDVMEGGRQLSSLRAHPEGVSPYGSLSRKNNELGYFKASK